jgi:putative peptidoglycan lipid II flippase
LAFFLSLPAAIALVISATPLVRGVFQHGAFTAADTLGTASALAAFSLGVPAYVLIKVLTPGFYARQDTKTPVRIAVVSMLFNLAGNLTLIWHLGHVGVALATAFSAWINTALLYWTLHRRGQLQLDARLRAKALRTILAGAAMGAALWFINPLADPWMAGDTVQRVIALGALCGAGALVYGVAALLFRAYTVRELKAALTRKK